MSFQILRKLLYSAGVLMLAHGLVAVSAQTGTTSGQSKTLARYVDQIGGLTATEAVRIALENNGELAALRKELEAARALVKQAGLRANPSLEANGTKQIGGMDNSLMVQGILPLELGGRRGGKNSGRGA